MTPTTPTTAAARRQIAPSLERVTVGFDFSVPSLTAVGWVRRHFAPRAECLIVHALDVPQPPRFLRAAFPAREEVLKSAREGAAARLERIRRAHDWGDVRLRVREGRPEDVISEEARAAGADLVIVGEHARPRGIWESPGSTAEALVRGAPVPVLLARNPPDHAPERILVAVDDSDHARLALQWTRLLAERFGSSVLAFHVFRPVYIALAKAVSGIEASAGLEQEQVRQSERWLDEFVREAGFQADDLSKRVEPGDPASTLVAAQRGGSFDLVVIGSRGAGGAGRMLLGSVANGVLRGASCPVLVARDHNEPG
ncbi:MAG TPA: universal stress protein [Longimicrobiales bacterium]